MLASIVIMRWKSIRLKNGKLQNEKNRPSFAGSAKTPYLSVITWIQIIVVLIAKPHSILNAATITIIILKDFEM